MSWDATDDDFEDEDAYYGALIRHGLGECDPLSCRWCQEEQRERLTYVPPVRWESHDHDD